jgi:hypothetical protein
MPIRLPSNPGPTRAFGQPSHRFTERHRRAVDAPGGSCPARGHDGAGPAPDRAQVLNASATG